MLILLSDMFAEVEDIKGLAILLFSGDFMYSLSTSIYLSPYSFVSPTIGLFGSVEKYGGLFEDFVVGFVITIFSSKLLGIIVLEKCSRIFVIDLLVFASTSDNFG